MKKQGSFAGDLAERLALPGEAVGTGKLSVIGGRRAVVENHRGLLKCTEEEIAARTERGSVHIFGARLCLEAMNEKELLICGRLERVEWNG